MSSTTEKRVSPSIAGVRLEAMTEHDLLEVVEIEERSGLSRWGWSAYYAELQGQNRSLMLVARVIRPLESEETYNIAGYIVARMGAEELHINNVAVRQDFRGRGLGSALVARILDEGNKLGAQNAFLEVRSGNVAAQRLYEKCGFKPIALRKDYYSEPAEDAVVMSALLKP